MKISKHSQQCNRYLFRTYNSISIQTMRPPIYRLSFSLKYLLLLICVTFRQIKTTYFTHFFFLLFFQEKQILANMEFGRRMAIERELEKSESFDSVNPGMEFMNFDFLYFEFLLIIFFLYMMRCG